MKHFTEALFDDLDTVQEGYADYSQTAPNLEREHTLWYGHYVIATCSDNPSVKVRFESGWQNHVKELISWLQKHKPGFFQRVDKWFPTKTYKEFEPTIDEATKYISNYIETKTY